MTNGHEGAASPEDKYRMNAAQHLDAMLSYGPRMLELCEKLVDGKDAALMLSSVARLMQGAAAAALAQLRVTMGETRHRSISEKGWDHASPGLNSKFSRYAPSPEEVEKMRAEIDRRIDVLVARDEQMRRERAGEQA